MHHAYFFAGNKEIGLQTAKAFVADYLGTDDSDTPDVIVLEYGLFPVEEARKITDVASRASVRGVRKGIIISVSRIFHEAQNALLKVFEEPPEGTMLILIVPSAGLIIPTLRSRLLQLQGTEGKTGEGNERAEEFLKASPEVRKKIVEKILTRAKSEKQLEKDAARSEALELCEGLTRVVYTLRAEKPSQELDLFLDDLAHFIPILHERSAPLKLIFEHVVLTTPKN